MTSGSMNFLNMQKKMKKLRQLKKTGRKRKIGLQTFSMIFIPLMDVIFVRLDAISRSSERSLMMADAKELFWSLRVWAWNCRFGILNTRLCSVLTGNWKKLITATTIKPNSTEFKLAQTCYNLGGAGDQVVCCCGLMTERSQVRFL